GRPSERALRPTRDVLMGPISSGAHVRKIMTLAGAALALASCNQALDIGDPILSATSSTSAGGASTTGTSSSTSSTSSAGTGTGTGAPATTTASLCGNGRLDQGEKCDDGNTFAGDHCDDRCEISDKFTCTFAPSVCFSSPGDEDHDNTDENRQ